MVRVTYWHQPHEHQYFKNNFQSCSFQPLIGINNNRMDINCFFSKTVIYNELTAVSIRFNPSSIMERGQAMFIL
jgi:hypothetical protein